MPGSIQQQLDTNGRAAPGVYSPSLGAGQVLPLPAAGTILTDTNNGGQQYAAELVQIGDRTDPTKMASVDILGNLSVKASVPYIVQKDKAASTGSVASLAKIFPYNNTTGNTIVVVCGCGNGTAMTVADSAGNTYVQAATAPNSTTFEAAIFFAVNIAGGANTVTVTNAGSAASMALEIYEVAGFLAQVPAQPDQASIGTGTGTTASTSNVTASVPHGIAFLGVAVGTAAQAVSVTTGTSWTLDSTQNTTTPAGLYTFGALSLNAPGTTPFTPKATIASSEPWAAAVAIFRPVSLPIRGTVTIDGYNYTHMTTQATTLCKSGAGVLHAIIINKPLASGVIEFDDALSQTNAMGIITLPATLLQDGPKCAIYDVAFATGLSVTTSGANQDVTIVWK